MRVPPLLPAPKPRRAASTAVALLCVTGALACEGPPTRRDAGWDAGVDAGPCPRFGAPEAQGAIDDPALDELSGLAASRAYPGLWYAHNDSGDDPRVFVLDSDAQVLARLQLRGATHVDFEDLAVGPGPDGRPWVFVGDVGDNAAREGSGPPRDELAIWRFPEPVALEGDGEVTPERVTLRYPAAPRDAEALFVDAGGGVFLISKEDAGPATLFLVPAGDDVVLEPRGTVPLGTPLARGSRNATGADLSTGGELLVRTYTHVHLWRRAPAERWADALQRSAEPAPGPPEPQGEAVAWSLDGEAYFTASEGSGATLFRVAPAGCAAP